VPIGIYHDVEGGAISQSRQPPPGLDQPYPNLADVPAATPPAAPNAQAAITARAHSGVSAANAGALAGLTLPTAAPPPPPGVVIHAAPAPAAPAAPPPPPPAVPPVTFAFAPGSALLPPTEATAVQKLATTRGTATLLVGGYGEGSLALALERARRLADALTANGVPASALRITAMASGSGGFVQLVY
jgi:outer membrane protein OmpA-like peptidoglycan-associated protein